MTSLVLFLRNLLHLIGLKRRCGFKMGSWTRKILAELESNGSAVRSAGQTRGRRQCAARPESFEPDSPEAELSCIDFGSRLMSLSELAEASGIGQKLLRGLVRRGRLRSIRVPGAQRHRYSPQQLARIIREHNQH
jgi:hypothetical protein